MSPTQVRRSVGYEQDDLEAADVVDDARQAAALEGDIALGTTRAEDHGLPSRPGRRHSCRYPGGYTWSMQLTTQDDLLKALRRIEGQVRGIHRMIEDGRDCVDVVRQMTATRAALDALAHRTVAENLRACVDTADLSPDAARSLELGLSALKGMRL